MSSSDESCVNSDDDELNSVGCSCSVCFHRYDDHSRRPKFLDCELERFDFYT